MIYNNGTIAVNRGDLFRAPLFINDGTVDEPIRYSLLDNPDTKIYFSIMQPNELFENATIRKIFTVKDANSLGDVIITLTSRETYALRQGKYYYQIKAVLQDGTINTITDKEIFYVR